MSGTSKGGAKASTTVKQRYGADHYKKIGAVGGRKSRGGGFASMSADRLKEVSRKGGSTSRRMALLGTHFDSVIHDELRQFAVAPKNENLVKRIWRRINERRQKKTG